MSEDITEAASEILKAARTILRLRAENEKLRAALKPFADAADDIEHGDKDSYNLWEHPAAMWITIGDLRNCQRILDGSTIE